MTEDMRRKLERAFERLQGLEIKPTVDNMERLLQCLYDIRDVYNNLQTKGGEEDGRETVDSGGRDGD